MGFQFSKSYLSNQWPGIIAIPGAAFANMELTLIQARLNNHLPGKGWNEITNPFSNFNDCIVEVWERVSNFIQLYNECNYLFMLASKLNDVSKMALGLGTKFLIINFSVLDIP